MAAGAFLGVAGVADDDAEDGMPCTGGGIGSMSRRVDQGDGATDVVRRGLDEVAVGRG